MSWKKVAYLDEVATLSNNAPVDVKVQTADKGVGTAASRDDHKHNVTSGVPGSITENVVTPLEGTSANLARADHTHGTPADWTPKAHTLDSHSEKKLDTLDEKTATVGVTVDGCLIKDGLVADSNKLEGSTKTQVQDHTPKAHTLASHSELKLDTLGEVTLNAGVTVDTCLIKDGKVADSNLLEGSNKATVQDHAPQAHALSGHTQATAELLINKQALRNPVIDPQATAPATPVDGQVYYSTADDHLYAYVA